MLHLQAHTHGGCWGVWLGVSRPTPRGDVEGSGWGGSPGPHPGGPGRGSWSRPARGWGWIPACTEADPPSPSRRLLLWVVRILLECILVLNCVIFSRLEKYKIYRIILQNFGNTRALLLYNSVEEWLSGLTKSYASRLRTVVQICYSYVNSWQYENKQKGLCVTRCRESRRLFTLFMRAKIEHQIKTCYWN